MREPHPLVADVGVELIGDAEPCREVVAWLPIQPQPASPGVRGAERRRPVVSRRIVVHVTRGDPYRPASADGGADGWREVMRHHQVVVWRDEAPSPARIGGAARVNGHRFLAAAPGASALLGDGGVDLRLHAEARPEAARATFEIIWPLLLPRYGLVHLHAGAVRDDAGRGWILTGDANSGKSTGTLALATAGWAFAADDAVYLERRHPPTGDTAPDGDGAPIFIAHGWAEAVRLSARSAAALSVERATPSSPVKSEASLDAARSARRTRGFPIDRIVFTELGDRTAVRSVTAGESLTRLLRSSGWIVAQPLPAADYLEFLAGLAALPALQLTAGPELLEAPARLADALRAAAL